jgi:tetratricopeptide (TPR) repeat protein
MAWRIKAMLQTMMRLLPIAFLLAFLVPALWRGWRALPGNYAFVTLNQLPSLFAPDLDPAVLARTESQLLAALEYHPQRASTRRMLAVVRRAQGANAPAGLNAGELLEWGQRKEQVGEAAAAHYLYQWAIDVEPDLGDSWYRLGRLYQTQAAVTAALHAYERAALAPTWQNVGRSDVYAAQADVLLVTQPGESLAAARARYRQALAVDHFGDAAGRATTHYRLGELLLWHENDPAAAVPHYRASLATRPADHWARLRLGYALYWSGAGVSVAEREILTAIAHWPDEKYLIWPYFYLGEMYENAGLPLKAIAAYEQVIDLDPANERVQARLVLLRSR